MYILYSWKLIFPIFAKYLFDHKIPKTNRKLKVTQSYPNSHLYPLIAFSFSLCAPLYSSILCISHLFILFCLTHFIQLHYMSPLSNFFYFHLFSSVSILSLSFSLPSPPFSYSLLFSLFLSLLSSPTGSSSIFTKHQLYEEYTYRHRFEVCLCVTCESRVNHRHHKNIMWVCILNCWKISM